MIEITNLLKEILNISLIQEIERVPFRSSLERCDGLFNSICVTRRNDPVALATALATLTRSRTTRRVLQFAPRKLPVILNLLLFVIAFSFSVAHNRCHTPIDDFRFAYGLCIMVMAAMRPEKLRQQASSHKPRYPSPSSLARLLSNNFRHVQLDINSAYATES